MRPIPLCLSCSVFYAEVYGSRRLQPPRRPRDDRSDLRASVLAAQEPRHVPINLVHAAPQARMQDVRTSLEQEHDRSPDGRGAQPVRPFEPERLPPERAVPSFASEGRGSHDDSAQEVQNDLVIHRGVPAPDEVSAQGAREEGVGRTQGKARTASGEGVLVAGVERGRSADWAIERKGACPGVSLSEASRSEDEDLGYRSRKTSYAKCNEQKTHR
mmetsp:Transcript_41778/g.77300  ORF Transcript_41778/g.77300 Transcript_41778/m.77300 type:complete len:215 (-) Transcript_41778:134-778(-)